MKAQKIIKASEFKQNISQASQRQLVSQIEQYRSRIQIFQNLQKQVNTISQTFTKVKSKQEISTSHTITQIPERKKTSIKKAKIYQLQRKLNKLKYQLTQKRNDCIKLKDQLEKVIGKTIESEKRIKIEKENQVEMEKFSEQVNQNIINLEKQTKFEELDSEEREKNEKIFKFEKQCLIRQLSKIKNGIYLISQHLKSDIKLNNSANSLSEDDSVNFQFSQTKSIVQLFNSPHHWRKKTLELLELLQIDQNQKNRIRENMSEEGQQNQSQMDLNQHIFKKIHFLLKNSQNKTIQLVHTIYQIQQTISNLTSNAKHKSLTQKLTYHQIQFYKGCITKLKEQQNLNSIRSQEIGCKISKLQGKRGQIRGKLGMKVEQVSIVNLVNLQMSKDLKILDDRIQTLKRYWRQIKLSTQ